MTMHRTWRFSAITVVTVAVAGLLTACATTKPASVDKKPVVVEPTADTDIQRLTLTDLAADRLDIQTVTVETAGSGKVVPSAAVIIDTAGSYWVYTNPEPLVFVREEIRSVQEEGLQAFFENGPESGTAVVTVGVPELYGAEFGIGK